MPHVHERSSVARRESGARGAAVPRRRALVLVAAGHVLACLASSVAAGREPGLLLEPHPALDAAPRHTTTAHGRPGDPVNVALVGSDEDLHRGLAAAGWYPADPITLATSVRIAADVVLAKPYPHAPVSDLYLFDRRQDAAFEQPVGRSPKQRHHVRFWRTAAVDGSGRPLWLGAATFDERVEISRTTGGITHRIAADVDRERNKILLDAHHGGAVDVFYWMDRFHAHREGRNGGGDPYHTDGRLAVGILAPRR